MSGRCRTFVLTYTVSEEFNLAQEALNLHHDVQDLAVAEIADYDANITEMYHTLMAARAEKEQHHVEGAPQGPVA